MLLLLFLLPPHFNLFIIDLIIIVISLGTKTLQQEMGIAVIKFFSAFTYMLLEMDKKNDMKNDSKNDSNTNKIKRTECDERSNVTMTKSQLIGTDI